MFEWQTLLVHNIHRFSKFRLNCVRFKSTFRFKYGCEYINGVTGVISWIWDGTQVFSEPSEWHRWFHDCGIALNEAIPQSWDTTQCLGWSTQRTCNYSDVFFPETQCLTAILLIPSTWHDCYNDYNVIILELFVFSCVYSLSSVYSGCFVVSRLLGSRWGTTSTPCYCRHYI